MDGKRHFLLATEYRLGLLREAKRWYMDETLKVLGEPFNQQGQLMSIHAFIERIGAEAVALVFCLMSRKTTSDYLAVFRSLQSRLGHVSLEGFVLDFEKGWHHRLNSRAVHMRLGFYQIVPLLQREADLVLLTVQCNDLGRERRGYRFEKSLNTLWDQYMQHEIKTSKFFSSVGELYVLTHHSLIPTHLFG